MSAGRKYLSIPEAAKQLHISRIALYHQVRQGKIKAIRIGRNYAIEASTLVRYLAGAESRVIEAAVVRTIKEYGEVLRRLKDE